MEWKCEIVPLPLLHLSRDASFTLPPSPPCCSLVCQQAACDVTDDLSRRLHRELNLIQVIDNLVQLVALVIQALGSLYRSYRGYMSYGVVLPQRGRVSLHTSPASLPPLSPFLSLAPHLSPDVQRIVCHPLRSVQPCIDLINLPVALPDQLHHAHLCEGGRRGGRSGAGSVRMRTDLQGCYSRRNKLNVIDTRRYSSALMVCLKGPMGSRGLTAAGSQRAPFDTLLYSSDGLGGRQVGADERRGTKQALTLQVLRVGCG